MRYFCIKIHIFFVTFSSDVSSLIFYSKFRQFWSQFLQITTFSTSKFPIRFHWQTKKLSFNPAETSQHPALSSLPNSFSLCFQIITQSGELNRLMNWIGGKLFAKRSEKYTIVINQARDYEKRFLSFLSVLLFFTRFIFFLLLIQSKHQW